MNMQDSPFSISIICPLFNKEKFLPATVRSVIAQTDTDWELVVVDDGSTDNSLLVINKLAEKDRRIRVLERRHYSDKKGANVCRNIGVEVSVNDYLIFLDADDILLPYCLAQRKKAIQKCPQFDIYVFNVAYWRNGDALPFAKRRPSCKEQLGFYLSLDRKQYFLKRFLAFDLPWHTSGPVWNKNFIVGIGGFSEKLARLQDPEIHTRALLSSAVTLKYLKTQAKYDILHRKDEDRGVWDEETFLFKQIESIKDYLSIIIPRLLTTEKKSLLRFLQGYLIFGETLVYRAVRRSSPAARERLIPLLDSLYEVEGVDKVLNKTYRVFQKLLRKSMSPRFMRLKVPGILLFVYKSVL